MRRFVLDAPTLVHVVAEGVEINPQHQVVAPNLIRSEALLGSSRPSTAAS